MKENVIEAYLRKRVKELGGVHRKVTYQGRNGALDDWCFFPDGRLLIVECKRPGVNKLDPLQKVEMQFLMKMGFNAAMVNTKMQVDKLLEDFFNEQMA